MIAVSTYRDEILPIVKQIVDRKGYITKEELKEIIGNDSIFEDVIERIKIDLDLYESNGKLVKSAAAARIESVAVPVSYKDRLEVLEREIQRLRDENEELKSLLKNGESMFEKKHVVIFELPSEYLKGKKEHLGKGRYVVQTNEYANELWKLRQKFYNKLKKVAFRAPIGWILIKEEEKKELDLIIQRFNEIIRKLGVEEERGIRIEPIYLRKTLIKEYLERYIRELQEKLMDVEQKLTEITDEVKEKKKMQRYETKKRQLEALIAVCKHELGRYLI